MNVPPRHIWQLDAIRGAAAAYVVVYHMKLLRGTPLDLIFAFGPEAVMVFFVLSGFVISLATEGRALPLRSYLLKRFVRIYPLFLIALPYSYVVACLIEGGRVPVEWATLMGNVLMLQDLDGKLGTWIGTYQYNFALWTLSYEWWFYLLFPATLAVLRRTDWQRSAVLGVALAGAVSYRLWPNPVGSVLSYFFIWWSGVELCREWRAEGTVTWRRQWPSLVGLAALTAVWAVPVAIALVQRRPLAFGFEPVLQVRHFAAALGVVAAVLAYAQWPLAMVSRLLRPFLPLGAISYALYVFHQPPLRVQGTGPRAIILVGLVVWCVLMERVVQPAVARTPTGRRGRDRPTVA